MLAFVDEHGFDDSQVVVEGDDGVQEGDEDEHVVSLLRGGGKYEEFAEESGEGRYSGRREEGQHHDEAQAGVGGV